MQFPHGECVLTLSKDVARRHHAGRVRRCRQFTVAKVCSPLCDGARSRQIVIGLRRAHEPDREPGREQD